MKKFISLHPEDQNGIERMRSFQLYMVDSVSYNNDLEFYLHEEEMLKQRPGIDLWNYTVSDNNLESVYGNMVLRLAQDIFTAYPIDKRAGRISQTYCSTVFDNDLMYTVLFDDGSLCYVIPRSDKNHYYLDELPFYYEDIPVLLLHAHDYANYDFNQVFVSNEDGSGGRRNFNTEYREIRTPASNPKDNYRTVQAMANVNLENQQTSFMARVILSGQYSTLTRCAYCSKPVDSTINEAYHDPVWNVSENATLEQIDLKHPDLYYPFKTQIQLKFSSEDLVHSNDSMIVMDIGSCLKLICEEQLCSGPRYQDYYPDFQGCDRFSIMIAFNQPVKLLEGETSTEIKNQYAHLVYSAKQTAENKILVICNHSVLAPMVPSEEFDLVKEVVLAIADIKKMKLKLKVADDSPL
jgi:hypothetical protein